MKNLIRIIMAITYFFLILSCSEDFIDLNPLDTVSVTALYKTDSDFNDAVNGAYRGLNQVYRNMWWIGDMRGDDAWDELQKDHAPFDLFFVQPDHGVLGNTYRDYYITISRANEVLSRIEDFDASVIPNKDRYIGEARFIRALSYFNLVRIFGDMPMVTEPVTAQEAYLIPREPVATIYNQVIIPDLLDAENKLPESYPGSLVGKATKGAARSLLGKVYLTVHDFEKAEAMLMKVTTMGYALLDDFNDLFYYDKGQHHSEYIFDIEYLSGGVGLGHNNTNNFTPKDPPTLVHYNIVGSGNGFNNPPPHLFDLFPPGDERKYMTVGDGHWYIDDEGNEAWYQLLPTSNDAATYTRKYIFTTMSSGGDSPANWKVVRYADVLLMLAEAMNENGKTGQALPYLNQVRNRAGLEGYAGLTQTETREMIYLERRLELSFESHRWFDLVRTGRAFETLAHKGMQNYMTIFPVPQNQIDLYNDPEIFWQNPGY